MEDRIQIQESAANGNLAGVEPVRIEFQTVRRQSFVVCGETALCG